MQVTKAVRRPECKRRKLCGGLGASDESCAEAWVQATKAVRRPGNAANPVVLRLEYHDPKTVTHSLLSLGGRRALFMRSWWALQSSGFP